jgi:hypothetical protein
MTMVLNETDLAIRAYFANDLSDAKYAKRVVAHKEPKVVLCGSYDNRLMYSALCEGTLGRAFRTFTEVDPKGAMGTIQCALRLWYMSGHNPKIRAQRGEVNFTGVPVGMGAFSHNFTEIAAGMAEPYLPLHVNHFGHNAWMLDAWDWFASNVARTA